MVNEEAKHPGRPQPHMVARNPLWGGESGPNPDKTEVPQVEEPLRFRARNRKRQRKKESKIFGICAVMMKGGLIPILVTPNALCCHGTMYSLRVYGLRRSVPSGVFP